MSYLLDKKAKRKKYFYILLGVLFFLIIFYFHNSIFRNLSYIANKVFIPVMHIKNNISSNFSKMKALFYSKETLLLENEDLKTRLEEYSAQISNYKSLMDENYKLKMFFERKGSEDSFILGTILGKPNRSLYDTLIIDIGENKGIVKGDMVFALGTVPIGNVAEVFANSSKVILFSNSNEKTEAIISGSDVFVEVIGRGGGNFEIVLPRNFDLFSGTEIVLPGIFPYTLGIVESIISDPRDSFTKALLRSPVNIQELKFVQVKI